MKKLPLLLIAVLLLVGCDRGRSDLEAALVKSYSEDQDIKDYNIDPNEMAGCVSKGIASTIPGFPGSPDRLAYFEVYTKLVQVKADQKDPEAVLEEAAKVFGSRDAAFKAALRVTDFVLQCMGDLVEVRDQGQRGTAK